MNWEVVKDIDQAKIKVIGVGVPEAMLSFI